MSGERSFLGRSRTAAGVLAAGALAAAAVGGCGSSGSSSGGSGGGGGGKPSITVGLSVDDSSYAPLYLGVDRGLFARDGTNVKLVVFQGGSDLTKALVGGSVDVAVGALSGMIPAVEQHQSLRAFYGGFDMVPFAWYGQPDVRTIAQGRGKTWGVSRIGSSTDFLTRYLLRQNGIDPVTGVKVAGVGGGTGQLAAMRARQIDVTVASPPTTYQLVQAGFPVIARESDLVKQYPTQVAYAKTSYINGHRSTLQAFLRGLSEGMTMAKDDPNAAADEIASHVRVGQDVALESAREDGPYWFADGRMPSASDMKVFWQIGVQNQAWPSALPDSQWLDPEFIGSASGAAAFGS